FFFFFQAEDGIRDFHVTGVQTCALPICTPPGPLRNRYEALPSRWHNHSCPPQRGKGAEEPEPEAEKEGRRYQEKPRKTADLAGPSGPDKVGDTTKRKAPPLAEEQPARRNRAGR